MTIQYASDLHLEFPENAYYLRKNPLIPTGEILLLAGDICPMGEGIVDYYWFLNYISDHWSYIYWVPGNHEYYECFPLEATFPTYYIKVRSNIEIVNNLSVTYKSVDIFFSTLWSKLDPGKFHVIYSRINDFFWINYKNFGINEKNYNYLHEICFGALQEFIGSNTSKHKIVVTHHVPTFLCNPDKFKNSLINSAFVVELSDFILDNNIDYWIYGHHHYNMPEKSLGKTKLITNQLGYFRFGDTDNFRHDAVIEIGE
jgi:hypothetical protein